MGRHDNVQDQRSKLVTKDQELKRYKSALQDEANYSAYPASRERAKAALNLSKPLQISTPHRALGVAKGEL